MSRYRAVWVLGPDEHPIDRVLRIERSFPGAVESFRAFITRPTDDRWTWLDEVVFACVEDGTSMLRLPTLCVSSPHGIKYVWWQGVWVISMPELREFQEGLL